MAVDPELIAAWFAGRSLARGLPPPLPDRGGLRVDTGAEAEIARWVFATPDPAITALSRAIDRPGYQIKLCGPAATLRRLLTGRWRIVSEHCMMFGPGEPPAPTALPPGYYSVARHAGAVSHLRISAPDGLLAASGYAAEVDGAFVYDRILTVPEHRRRGLGRAVMAGLASYRRSATSTDILTATGPGRALYAQLGWTVYAPWSTATIPVG